MKKLTKILSSISLFTALSVASYATDLHLSLEAGALANIGSSYSKADGKKDCETIPYWGEECSYTKAGDEFQPEKQRKSFAPYLDLQAGVDIEIDPVTNVTAYVDYGWLAEFGGGIFSGLSHTGMYGAGATGAKKVDDISYLAGLELHTASFDVGSYGGSVVSYGGIGETLSGGALFSNGYTIKAIFMHNSYTLNDAKWEGALPKEVSTNSLGVSVGYKFH